MTSRRKRKVAAAPPERSEAATVPRRANLGMLLYAAFALGLVLSGVRPDPRLWGVHQYAFLSRTAWWLAAIVLSALFVPAMARMVGRAAETLGAALLRRRSLPVALGALLLVGAFMWRIDFPFLGDGLVWVTALKEGKLFHHFEPLAATWVRLVATAWSPHSPDTAAGVLSILLGPVYVVATAWLCRTVFAEALGAGVAWLLLLLHPMLLLYFGYVESYPLVIVFQLSFALTAVASARGRLPMAFPAMLLGLAMAAHLTALAWSPALALLPWTRESKSRRWRVFAAISALLLALLVAIAAAGAVGSSPGKLLSDLWGQAGLGGQSASWMFSWRHALDLLNELTLLLAPALILLGAASYGKDAVRSEAGPFASPTWRVLGALLPGPLAVALFVEPRIGGGRDWDLYLPLALPMILLTVRLWRSQDPRASGNSALGKAAASTIGGTVAGRADRWVDAGRALGFAAVFSLGWLAIGVDEGRTVRRLEVLQEARGTFSNFARGYANETLGIYYRGRNSQAARAAWSRAAQANPANARYFNNLGIEALRCDDLEAACEAFHRTLELGMEEYFVYFNVANCERRAGEYEAAEKLYDHLIETWPQRWEAYGARGLVRVHQGRAVQAMEDLQIALRLAPNEAETHYTLGLAYQAQGQGEEARREWERTLELDPKHAGARQQLAPFKAQDAR